MKDRPGIEYCYDCRNKGFSVLKGVFCALTNDYPRFKETCKDYDFDSSERNRLELSKKEYFGIENDSKIGSKTKYLFGLKKALYRETKKNPSLEIRNWKELPGEIEFHKKYRISIITDFLVLVAFLAILHFSTKSAENIETSNYFFLFSIIIWAIRLAYFIIQTQRKKVILRLNEKGIEHYKKGKFSWQEIVLTLIKTKRGFGNVNYDYLVISLVATFEPIVIPLNLLDKYKIENSIELYKEKIKQQRHNKGYTP